MNTKRSNTEKERGAAQINIKVSNGKLTVRHTNQKGAILFESDVKLGTWNKIWEAIREGELS